MTNLKIASAPSAARTLSREQNGPCAALSRLLLALAALLGAFAGSPASALESNGVMFLWNDRADAPLHEVYRPNASYRSEWNDLAMGLRRTGLGQYTATFGLPHEPLVYPVISQVVAYGSDNVRCKLQRPSQPVWCVRPDGKTGVCTEVYVACHTAQGASANSRFVLQLAAWPHGGNIGTAHGGFIETANGGTAVQKTWIAYNNRFIRGPDPAAGNSAHRDLPTLTRSSTGLYSVRFRDLALRTPLGSVQVTAIGNDAAHCKPSSPPNPTVPGSSWLHISIRCYVGNTLADSDFSLMYDTYTTRKSGAHQAARAYANQPTGNNYTPSRSWNSGGSLDEYLGRNDAGHYGPGWYFMRHTELSPTNSAAYVVAVGANPHYCKPEWWGTVIGTRGFTEVRTRCFDANGNAVDTRYLEAYQGPMQAPI